ncbi:MAG: hypothetical protein EXR86_07285 [Gammaproteobacteria bacterium]|nr:hypothetical protein [Gammaproteobacteria bacterium]
MNHFHAHAKQAGLALCLLSLITFKAWPQTADTARTTAAEALAAYARFALAPEQNLKEAPIFLGYMQSGAVHAVLNANLLFWMYRPFPPDVQAVLYAAYMGGNLHSQLETHKQGDDPAAGMSAAIDAYAGLKETHADLKIAEFEQLLEAQRAGNLASAVDALASGVKAP